MKQKHSGEGQSGYWAKLMSALVAVGIVVVLVFNGFQSVLGQVSDLQRRLAKKSTEYEVVSGQLVEANREMIAMNSELIDLRNAPAFEVTELESAKAKLSEAKHDLANAQSQLDATNRELRDKTSEFSDALLQIDDLKTELSEKTDLLEAVQAELSARSTFCESESAFAKQDSEGITFDLLCRPMYPKTIELKRGRSINISVDLAQFKEASGQRRVRFLIHFAIDHGRLEIHQVGSGSPRELSDSGGRNLRDFEITSEAEEVQIKITSVGKFRGAKFDLAMWPL